MSRANLNQEWRIPNSQFSIVPRDRKLTSAPVSIRTTTSFSPILPITLNDQFSVIIPYMILKPKHKAFNSTTGNASSASSSAISFLLSSSSLLEASNKTTLKLRNLHMWSCHQRSPHLKHNPRRLRSCNSSAEILVVVAALLICVGGAPLLPMGSLMSPLDAGIPTR